MTSRPAFVSLFSTPLLAAMLGLMACMGCQPKTEPAAEKAAPPEDPNTLVLSQAQVQRAGLVLDTLKPRSIARLLKVSGKVDVPPKNIVSISVPLGGYLRSSRLLPGQFVRRGEVLATVEDQQYIQLQQDYLTARAELAFDKADYERQAELNRSKASSDKVTQQALARYQKQVVMVNALGQKLRLIGLNPARVQASNISRSIALTSPISGFVNAVNGNIGKYVTPADVLYELVNPQDIHLALTVFEQDVNDLFVGQRLFAFTNQQPERRHPCRIILITRSIADDRAATVHCHFEDYDPSLLPGMFMNAEVELNSRKMLALPQEAIVRFANKDYVFMAKPGNSYQMMEVQSGATEDGYTQVLNLDKWHGQPFVVKGAYTLLMALKNEEEEE